MASFVPPQPGSGSRARRSPRPRGPRGGPGGGVSQPRPRPQPRPGPSFPQPNAADLMNQGLEAFRNWNQTGQGGGGFPGQAAPPQAPADFFTGYGAQSQTPQLGNLPELGRMGQGGFTGGRPSPQQAFQSPWGEVPALASFGKGFGG